RREFIARTAGAAALASLPLPAFSKDLLPVKTATLFGGWAHLGNDALLERGFDKKHGFDITNVQTYNSLATLYADFIKGVYEVGVGSWDFFAKVYMRGAPLRIIGMISEGTQAGYLGRADGPSSIKDLKGKTLAAMLASGTFQQAKAYAKEFDGIDFGTDVTVQNAPNPPATVALLAGNRADASLIWEHSLSLGLDLVKGSRVFTNLGEYYTSNTKRPMPYFCIAMHKNAIDRLPKGSVQKLVAMYDDEFKWIHSDVNAYAAMATRIKVKPEVIKTAIGSGRLRFQMRSAADAKNREDLLYAANLLTKAGVLPKKLDEGIFAA
ncbi:MAG: ABC transporter substrate-binding protein, partial [Hyphomicrobiaceae bacterium]